MYNMYEKIHKNLDKIDILMRIEEEIDKNLPNLSEKVTEIVNDFIYEEKDISIAVKEIRSLIFK